MIIGVVYTTVLCYNICRTLVHPPYIVRNSDSLCQSVELHAKILAREGVHKRP